MHSDSNSPHHHQPWQRSDFDQLAATGHEHHLFSTKTMIAMALLLGTAVGFGICTVQSHAGSSNQTAAESPGTSQSIGSYTGPVTYVPAPAVPSISPPTQAQIDPTGAQTTAMPGGQSAAPNTANVDMSTASGDFVNAQGIVYSRTYMPGPQYSMNPNWTMSRNGLIGNPSVDPASCQGRAYSMPLN